jgi:hypothetical protein
MQLIAERADIPRKLGHHAADLARSEMMHQDLENRTRGIFGAEGCNGQAIIAPLQKLLTGTSPVRLARRMQPIEIDSADEHWQLVAEMRCFVHCETVAQGMQDRTHSVVGSAVIRAKALRYLLHEFLSWTVSSKTSRPVVLIGTLFWLRLRG